MCKNFLLVRGVYHSNRVERSHVTKKARFPFSTFTSRNNTENPCFIKCTSLLRCPPSPFTDLEQSPHHITAQAQGEKQQNTTRGRSAALLQPLQLPFGPFHMRFVHGVGDAANRAADVAEGTMRIQWEANDDTVRRDRRRRAPQACSTKKGSVEQQ